MQQGRVQLDADWNELVELFDRRLRAETTDLVSRGPDPDTGGVAVVPRQTPDGFRITTSGGSGTTPPAIGIGRGRMYVDGLLAENFGAGAVAFDPVVAETHGTADLPYNQQPYFPGAPALPAGGPHLVYVDVWNREVTHVERPELVERAVGVDTTTRLQTVWQVRVLPNVGAAATCSTPDAQVAGWLDLIAPSAGRLSSTAVGVEAEDDPCELPAAGGYRGLENQLYRVEIHDGGGIGQATFKWSRDNASVASAVVELLSAHELRLASLGRDSVLRFTTGDWVEIIDDRRELAGEQADPLRRRGEMRKITIDEAKQTITFTPDLPAAMVPSGAGVDTPAARHLRVRRWDQKGVVRAAGGTQIVNLDAPASTGLIPVPASNTPVLLENGVQVTFSLAAANGRFRSGDYWVFAARTADASVEELDAAPPRGVHHHFARLAVVTFPGSPTDCRRFWPPDIGGEACECTVCVTPESHASGAFTLQMAVDQIAGEGGTICLERGAYLLNEQPVRIANARPIRIRGQGWSTLLVTDDTAIDVSTSDAFTIEDVSVLSVTRTGAPALAVSGCRDVRARGLVMLVRATGDEAAPAIGLTGTIALLDVRDSTIVAPIAIARASTGDNRPSHLATITFTIENNALWASRRAVSFDGLSLHLAQSQVRGNSVIGCADAGFLLTGAVAPRMTIAVAHNSLWVRGRAVVAGVSGIRIESNDVAPFGTSDGQDAFVLGPGLDPGGIDAAFVLGNRVTGISGTALLVAAPIDSAIVKHNILQDVGAGIVFESRSPSATLAIENNTLTNVAPTANAPTAAPVGIRVVGVQSVTVAGNHVRGVGAASVQAMSRAALQVAASRVVRICGNTVSGVGPPGQFVNPIADVDVMQGFERLEVAGNVIQRAGGRDVTGANLIGRGVWIHSLEDQPIRTVGPRFTAIRLGETNHLVINGLWAYAFATPAEMVAVRGNTIEGGADQLIRIDSRAECNVNDNQCLQRERGGPPAVDVGGLTMIASANRVAGVDAGMAVRADPKRLAIVGNVTNSPITVNGTALPTPWSALNVVV
jgi:hypothetical protein